MTTTVEGLPATIAGVPVVTQGNMPGFSGNLPIILEQGTSGPRFIVNAAAGDITSVPLLAGKSWAVRTQEMGDLMIGLDDNSHFASRLNDASYFERLLQNGEQDFLDSLTPAFIKECAAEFGGDIIRQGDIFFTRFSPCAVSDAYSFVKYIRFQLHGTRHFLTNGTMLELKAARRKNSHHRWPVFKGRQVQVIIRGTVEAPDHPNITIDEPHICMRSDAFQPPISGTMQMPDSDDAGRRIWISGD